ncbi:MAG: SpoIIE family protein phosphatase, partial [Selenomonadaceae bacterium]|nr:SpoIIE family protein phosphatase [Selenomonadaceae bacterium]
CAVPYFTATNEVAGVVGAGMFLNRINDIVQSTTLGATGFGFVINKEGRILFSSKKEGTLAPIDGTGGTSLFDAADESLAKAAHDMAEGGNGLQEVILDGVPCYLAYRPLTAMNCSFGIVMAVEEATISAHATEQVIADSTGAFLGTLDQSIRSALLAALLLVVLLLLLVPWASNKLATKFVQPIHELSDGVREIASGHLDKKLDIRTGNEIEHLAVCFNAMTDELQTYMQNLTKVAAEKERIATELHVATSIQESMLPRSFTFPEKLNFDIYASMHAAKEVGGDFYDFYLLDNKHLIFTIADVSGKGVPAALFMVISKTILKNFAQTMEGLDDLAPLVSCTNDQLCQNNDAMMFVTAFIGVLDLETGRLSYVNAGHNPPLVYRASEQRFSYLDVKRNFVLGGVDGLDYQGQEITLAPNDRLFLYTDGVTEALNEANELYGEERLLSCLNRAASKDLRLEDLIAFVHESLADYVQTAEQSDDITMLALTYLG